jgi:hypothetical protein
MRIPGFCRSILGGVFGNWVYVIWQSTKLLEAYKGNAGKMLWVAVADCRYWVWCHNRGAASGSHAAFSKS